MPYQVDSAMGAAAGALGGYFDAVNKKKQQQQVLQRQQQLDAQAQADTAARLGLEKSGQEATEAYRKAELGQSGERLAIERANSDRATATAAAEAAAAKEKARRDKLRETFIGKGFTYPSNWDKMPVDGKYGKIAYLEARRKNAAQNYASPTDLRQIDDEMGKARTEAEQARRDAALAKQRDTTNANAAQRLQISIDRPTGSDKPLTRYQQIQIDHWNKEHLNPDGSLKSTTKDTSGLSSMGNLQYQKDVRDWMMQGQDPASEPDPTSGKYEKKAAVLHTNTTSSKSTGPTKTGRSASAPGKPTLYEYSDGSWK